MNNLEVLEHFAKLENQDFKLTKIKTKRASRIGVGQFETGTFSLVEIHPSGDLPEGVAVMVKNNGYSFLRTSPIVKIVETTDTSILFETEGGVYLLEKYSGQ